MRSVDVTEVPDHDSAWLAGKMEMKIVLTLNARKETHKTMPNLTPDEHPKAQKRAFMKSRARGDGQNPPPYDPELAVGDFWRAAGEVNAQLLNYQIRQVPSDRRFRDLVDLTPDIAAAHLSGSGARQIMHRALCSVAVCLGLLVLGCTHVGEQERHETAKGAITSEELLALGFKPSKTESDTFDLGEIPLETVLRELSLDLQDFHPTANIGSNMDVRVGRARGALIVIYAVRNGMRRGSLDEPQAQCEVSISLHPRPEYLSSDAKPLVRLLLVSKLGSGDIRVRLEVSAVGKHPLVIPRSDFWLSGKKVGAGNDDEWQYALEPRWTPDALELQPGKPIVVEFKTGEDLNPFHERVSARALSAGQYRMRCRIEGDPRVGPRFNFQFRGTAVSDVLSVALN